MEVGEKAETPAGGGGAAGGCTVERDGSGAREGPSPRERLREGRRVTKNSKP